MKYMIEIFSTYLCINKFNKMLVDHSKNYFHEFFDKYFNRDITSFKYKYASNITWHKSRNIKWLKKKKDHYLSPVHIMIQFI